MKQGKRLLLVVLMISLCRTINAQVVAGPLNPGTITTGTCSFSFSSLLSYAPTGNVVTSNNMYATAVHCACCDANTNCLRLTNFGFSIPAGAIITGILVEIEKRSDPGSQVEDNGLRLLQNGNEIGSNLANYGLAWPSSDTYLNYGGCSNLWGASWTPADINAANFGLVFASIDYSCLGNITSFIDHVRVSVCYNLTLPIELIYLIGKREKDQVKLSWGAQADKYKDYYVEYTIDGEIYTEIGSVKAKRTQSGISEFEYAHTNPLEKVSYYRLKVVKNGSTDYSSPISIDPYLERKILLYPNPCDAYVKLKGEASTEYALYDLFGKLIAKGITDQNEFRIDLTDVPSGVYAMKIAEKYFKLEILH